MVRSGDLWPRLITSAHARRRNARLQSLDCLRAAVTMASKLRHVSEDHAAWYRESLEHPDLFWGDLARARLKWSRDFDRVQDCDLRQGKLQWFIGGQINVSGELYLGQHRAAARTSHAHGAS